MEIEDTEPDGELSDEQITQVNELTEDEIEDIDIALLSFASRKHYRKMAYLVGMTITRFPIRVEGIPDIFYAQRVRSLVERGQLVHEGDLNRMRYCEVKIPD